jgi:hypothetical protein
MLASAIAVVTIAALWSGTASADPAVEVAACPLLEAAEVEAVFGQTLVAAEQEPMGGGGNKGRMTTCFWTPAGGSLGPTLSLILWSWPPGGSGAEGYMEAFLGIAEEYPDLPEPEVLAIGDAAMWDGSGVHVRKGDLTFSLAGSMNALDPIPDAQSKLEKLAAIVADRL